MVDQTNEVKELERILVDTSAEPVKISYATIQYITKNFAKPIGNGGFCTVYLGSLQNGLVAVKKISESTDFSDRQFLDEVTCLKKVNHRNIARFLGYCADTQGEIHKVEGKHIVFQRLLKLLCFEYVPNGNLHHYIKDKKYGYEWNVRYKIILGICKGLHHIHQEHINHLDLKPANVLLGENMEPKITDFGVSRTNEDQCTMVTQNVFGTPGYIAPELIDNQTISLKSDIFSLGVIIINLLTGHTGSITKNWHETIDKDGPQIKRCIEIAQNCVDKDPHNRPTTVEIVCDLTEIEIMLENDPPIINEPRNDPKSSLYQDVQRFLALPAYSLGQHSRVDTLCIEVDFPECLLEGSTKPGKISYQLLRFITGDFSDDRIISRGGHASIFKGVLNQHNVAVKRYYLHYEDDQKFHQEIKAMTMVRHKNILQFLGYCSHTEEESVEYGGKLVMAEIRDRLLCFEYLSKGTLNDYISDVSAGFEWEERYKIIKGICEGLHYLHEKRIVHFNIKPTAIMLDGDMVPKLHSFHLSRCFEEDQTREIITSINGSMAYAAPEFYNGVITFKSDIYSLGVMIAEILSGRRQFFIETDKVVESWRTRLGTSSTDALLEQVRVCAEISIACIENNPAKRPDMRCIIKMLGET